MGFRTSSLILLLAVITAISCMPKAVAAATRATAAASPVCSVEYPNFRANRCFRNPICSDRKGGGKSWGYNFDGVGMCWRKKETTASGVPKSYGAPFQLPNKPR